MKLKFLLSLFCLISPFYLMAQTVTGRVVDQSGEPLIGVSVVLKGTSHGTITDMDGVFHLNVDQTDMKKENLYAAVKANPAREQRPA